MDSTRNGEAGTKNMSLKNVLIMVDNIDESIDFYEELFGLRVITRQEGNVIMSEGLVLQDVDVWYDSTKIHTTPHNNMTELYFEETIAEKYNISTTLLCDTNHILYSNYSEVIVVGAGADAVDYKLISICHKGDIVVSQDYGVAAMALGKGAYAIHQSGKWYTNNNIDQMLMERHLNKKARRSSHKNHIKGPKKRTEEDDVRFAQSFEKMLMMVQEKFQKNTKTMETGEMQL